MEPELLLEGGAAGHMNHLYDNGDLTFKKLKEIFTAAAEGKLEGTEKTDGQNIMISYSVKDGRAKGVRNKTEIKSGGLTPEQLAAKFADRDNPSLKDAFKDALSAFERAVHGLDHRTQVELFGEDTNIYYNAEVMDPRTPNVINYDTKTLIIHRTGHGKFDLTTGEKVTADLSRNASKLEEIIKQVQDRLKSEEYGIQVDAVKRLKALNDKQPLNIAINRINSILSAANHFLGKEQFTLSDDSTISEYMMVRIYILMNSILNKQIDSIGAVNPIAKMNIAKRILGVKGISVNDIYKKISPEQKAYIKKNLLDNVAIKTILKTAISPLEIVVSDFATEMLRGLQSTFILDNNKEVKRLQKEVDVAIKAIQKSGNEKAMNILKNQLKKLKSANNVNAAAEGFVFDYDGTTYKFTGSFAPVNQILSVFKRNNKNVSKLQENKKQVKKADIVVIPGAFKPPHKGHLAMVKEYSKKAKRVVIFISALPRFLPNGKAVMPDKSKEIFEMFLDKMGLKNVEILLSQEATPFNTALSFIANKENNPSFAQPGQTIALGCSTKDEDEKRFKNISQEYAKEGVTIVLDPVQSFYENMSSTDMRETISNGNIKILNKFIPDKFANKKSQISKLIIKMFEDSQIVPQEKNESNKKVTESTIYDIINETIRKRGSKYCLVSKKSKKNLGCYKTKSGAKKREKQVQYFKNIKEMSASGAGAIAGPAVQKDNNDESSTTS